MRGLTPSFGTTATSYLMYMLEGSEITRARTASEDGRRTSHSLPVRTERGFDLTVDALDLSVTLESKVL